MFFIIIFLIAVYMATAGIHSPIWILAFALCILADIFGVKDRISRRF